MKTGQGGAAVVVADLSVADLHSRSVLRDIGFSLAGGARLGIVGESGAGKTTLALSLLGHFRPGLRLAAGSIDVAGRAVLAVNARELRNYRRTVVSYLGQDPTAALTPNLRVGDQISELMPGGSDSDAVTAHLEAVGLPGERNFARRFPHEVSGGQLQRVAIARALAPEPAVLVMDEPSASLDPVSRQRTLEAIERQVAARGITLILVSHDLALVARMADDVLVLRDGEVVEQGPVTKSLSTPHHSYARGLVDTWSETGDRCRLYDVHGSQNRDLLTVRGLTASHGRGKERSQVVNGIDLELASGECLALVGMSGVGKSTVARCLVGLHEPDAATIEVDGHELAPLVRHRPLADRRAIQLVPQDPQSSLNPRRRVGDILRHSLRRIRGMDRREANREAEALADRVRLARELLFRFPRELSGGERQRIAIARALAAQPKVLICDEVTSSLDASVEASILDLINDLRRDNRLAVLLIAHDLRVVRRTADRIAILHAGIVLEEGEVAHVLTNPVQDPTRSILAAGQPMADILQQRLCQNGSGHGRGQSDYGS